MFEPTDLVAALRPDDVLPFFLGAIVLVTPIVFILTKHQQRMASILHGRDRQTVPGETDARLLNEVAALRQLVAQQSIAIDDLAKSQRELAERLGSDAVRERLRNS